MTHSDDWAKAVAGQYSLQTAAPEPPANPSTSVSAIAPKFGKRARPSSCEAYRGRASVSAFDEADAVSASVSAGGDGF